MNQPPGLPAQRGGAKALLLTVLGEFVLPVGGQAWTSSLVAASQVLGIGEKNARQALLRIGEQGLIEGVRHGRKVRWTLTKDGRQLLESGAKRIYEFGMSEAAWNGEWLVAHCPVAEAQRSRRNELRTELAFLGFGELSPSLLVSPHVERDTQLRAVLKRIGLFDESVIFRSRTVSDIENLELVSRAWNLRDLESSYSQFTSAYSKRRVGDAEDHFRAVVELVHDWRRFPFADPELPPELLPQRWAGAKAVQLFHDRHRSWSSNAQCWFQDLETSERKAS